MVNFVWAIGASIAVSLISLVGIFALTLKDKFLEKILVLLIGFSAGGLLGAAFLHILPEALEQSRSQNVFLFVIFGFIAFFILERYFHWRHCHEENCHVHPFTYLNLVGDAVHNFADGLIIGASFVINIHFGVVTTLVIIMHEIPQEIGDFGVLLYGGFSKSKALFFNFMIALTCVLGAIVGYPLSQNIKHFSAYLLPMVAGGFIYIAACDLIPEIHRQSGAKRINLSIAAFVCGIIFVFLARQVYPH